MIQSLLTGALLLHTQATPAPDDQILANFLAPHTHGDGFQSPGDPASSGGSGSGNQLDFSDPDNSAWVIIAPK